METLNKDYCCCCLFLSLTCQLRLFMVVTWIILKAVDRSARVALVEDEVVREGGHISGDKAEEKAG